MADSNPDDEEKTSSHITGSETTPDSAAATAKYDPVDSCSGENNTTTKDSGVDADNEHVYTEQSQQPDTNTHIDVPATPESSSSGGQPGTLSPVSVAVDSANTNLHTSHPQDSDLGSETQRKDISLGPSPQSCTNFANKGINLTSASRNAPSASPETVIASNGTFGETPNASHKKADLKGSVVAGDLKGTATGTSGLDQTLKEKGNGVIQDTAAVEESIVSELKEGKIDHKDNGAVASLSEQLKNFHLSVSDHSGGASTKNSEKECSIDKPSVEVRNNLSDFEKDCDIITEEDIQEFNNEKGSPVPGFHSPGSRDPERLHPEMGCTCASVKPDNRDAPLTKEEKGVTETPGVAGNGRHEPGITNILDEKLCTQADKVCVEALSTGDSDEESAADLKMSGKHRRKITTPTGMLQGGSAEGNGAGGKSHRSDRRDKKAHKLCHEKTSVLQELGFGEYCEKKVGRKVTFDSCKKKMHFEPPLDSPEEGLELITTFLEGVFCKPVDLQQVSLQLLSSSLDAMGHIKRELGRQQLKCCLELDGVLKVHAFTESDVRRASDIIRDCLPVHEIMLQGSERKISSAQKKLESNLKHDFKGMFDSLVKRNGGCHLYVAAVATVAEKVFLQAHEHFSQCGLIAHKTLALSSVPAGTSMSVPVTQRMSRDEVEKGIGEQSDQQQPLHGADQCSGGPKVSLVPGSQGKETTGQNTALLLPGPIKLVHSVQNHNSDQKAQSATGLQSSRNSGCAHERKSEKDNAQNSEQDDLNQPLSGNKQGVLRSGDAVAGGLRRDRLGPAKNTTQGYDETSVDAKSTNVQVKLSKHEAELLATDKIQNDFVIELQKRRCLVDFASLPKEHLGILHGKADKIQSILKIVLEEETFPLNVGDEEALEMIRRMKEQFLSQLRGDHDSTRELYTITFHRAIRDSVDSVLEDLKFKCEYIPLPSYKVNYLRHYLQETKENIKRRLQEVEENFRRRLQGVEENIKRRLQEVEENIKRRPQESEENTKRRLQESEENTKRRLQESEERSLNCNVYIDIREGPNGDLGLYVRAERAIFRRLRWCVDMELAKLVTKETPVCLAEGLYLQENHLQVCQIEQNRKCLLRIATSKQPVLICAKAPTGPQLVVCVGNLATADCRVLVLPFCEGQTQWDPVHREILETGFLSTEMKMYAKEFESHGPGRPFTLTLHRNNDTEQKAVVVMCVPSEVNGKGKDDLREACKEAVKAAIAVIPRASVALPLRFDAYGSKNKMKKVMLTAIAYALASIKEYSPEVTVKVFVDAHDAESAAEVFSEMEKYLFRDKWIILRQIVPDFNISNRVRVVVKDVLSVKADVLVNSTDSKLENEKGIVSRILLEHAGPDLARQCKQKFPQGMADNVLAITESFGLQPQFGHIFHIALPEIEWSDQMAELILQEMKIRVIGCLATASARNYTTIAFPTLGLGKLQYPADRVADTMFTAAREFFSEMPHSSLKEVLIVCYPENRKAIQVFKTEESLHSYGELSPLKYPVVHIDLKNTRVQIVQGDPSRLQCAADHVITADSSSKRRPNSSCSHDDTSKEKVKEVKDAFRACQKDRTRASVQINIQTSIQTNDDDFVKDIIDAVMSDLHHAVMVYMVIQNTSQFHQLAGCFKKAVEKQPRQSVMEVLKTFIPGNTPAVQEASSSQPFKYGKKRSDSVQVLGPYIKTLEVVQELSELQVPEAYIQKASDYEQQQKDGSSVDLDASALFPPKRRQPQDKNVETEIKDTTMEHRTELTHSDVCTFTIPWERLKEVGEFIKSLTGSTDMLISCDETRHGITFSAEFDNFKQAVSLVWNQIQERSRGSNRGVESSESTENGAESFVRYVNHLEREALQYLLGEEFSQRFVCKEQDGKVRITSVCEPGSDYVSKIDSLRREDLQLPADELSRLGSMLDTKEEGLEAYVKPLHDQGKVAVLGFDYNTITKAKHLVGVKAGKVRVTSRARRRFDGGQGSGQADASPPQSMETVSVQSVSEFVTMSGIKILVYKTDITKLPVDAIVNAANGHLGHGGGVAAAIAKAAGPELDEEGDAYVRKNGPLKVTEVLPTTAGAMTCKKVLHAVGPRWDDYKDKAQCQQDLEETVFNCLRTAHSLQFSSLALSSISSAIFGVPRELCAQMYLSAVKSFDHQYGGKTSLTHIHFVDISDPMVSIIQGTFSRGFSTVVSGGSDGVTLPRFGSPQQQPTGTREKSDSLTGGAQGGCRPKMQTVKVEQEPFLGCGPRGSDVLKFKIQNLNLFVQQGTFSDVQTEALLLWQTENQIMSDSLSSKFMHFHTAFANEYVPQLRKRKPQRGDIKTTVVDNTLLVLPIMAPDRVQTPDIHVAVLNALIIANEARKGSIAIPRFLYDRKGSKDEMEMFTEGVRTALMNFMKLPELFLTDIFILDQDEKSASFLGNHFSQAFAMLMSLEEDKPIPFVKQNVPRSQQQPAAPQCSICLESVRVPKTLEKCGHTFCTACIDKSFQMTRPACPECQTLYGIIKGNQPENGKMKMHYERFTLPGYPPGILTITYNFPSGTQTKEHPNPGKRYSGAGYPRKAYLPDTPEGRKVLMLLKVAFDRRLIFTVGQSATTGQTDVVTWNDIHHKTNWSGGPQAFGYPDDGYLSRVQGELAAKGVTEKDLTDTQKDFIQNPKPYIKYEHYDFSNYFSSKTSR